MAVAESGSAAIRCRCGQAEKTEQLRAGEYRLEVERHFVDDILEQTPFAAQHDFDALLHGLLARVGVDVHRVGLAQTMAAILGLALDRWIPPPVEVEHV